MKKLFLISTAVLALTVAQAFSQCSVSISKTNITCSGNPDGTATANPSGGTYPPYTYLWNPTSQTSQTATGLAAGNYTVIVTDANNCTSTAMTTITPAPALGIIYPSPPSGCSPYTGTVTVNPFGGTPPYTYLWNTTPPQTTQTATGLAPGNYTVTVTDSYGCSVIGIETVSTSNIPSVSVSSTQSSCSSCSDGSATVNPSGGTPNYTYEWLPGHQNTQTANNLSVGNYTICVTDANGCSVCDTTTVGFTTGITSYSSINNILISPNPFSFSTTLRADNPFHNATLSVDNCFGQTVAQIKNISGQTVTFYRDNLPSGLYFLRLTEENKIIAIDKLVITDK